MDRSGIVTDRLDQRFADYKASRNSTDSMIKSDDPKIATKLLKSAGAQVSTQPATHYHPLYEPTNLQLPTKLREINQWARYFFRSDPIVNAATRLHAEFPVTGFRNVCDDPKIQKFYDNLTFDILKLPKFFSFFSLEYQKLGNVFPMGIWDDHTGAWGRFITLNPDYVEVETSLFSEEPTLRLDPDDGLKKIVQTGKPVDIYNKLDPKIIQYVKRGLKIPLSNFQIEVAGSDKPEDVVDIPQVTHCANATSMYEAYGLPPCFCVFKALMYKDVLRRAQFSIAKRHWKPVKVVKVGDETHHADNAALQNVNEALNAASQDPESWFIWHNYINFDYIASAGHVMPLNNEYDWVNKELYAGLGVNEAILTGGGVTFANASVALKILINKYMRFQKTMIDWVEENIYKPVARVQQFYKIGDDGEQELVYPKIEFEMMRLQDDAQQKNLLKQLSDKGIISKRTFLTYVGIDPEREKDLVKKEKDEELAEKKEQKKQEKQKTLTGPQGKPLPGQAGPPGDPMGMPPPDLGGGGMPPGGDLGLGGPGGMEEGLTGGPPGEMMPPEAGAPV